MKTSRIEAQAAGSQILLALLQWWLQNHCQVGRDHTLTKIISAKGWGPFIAGPKKSKTREDRITSAVDWDTLGKSTPRLQSLTVKAKLTTWWVFTVLCHSFSHSEKQNGDHYVSFHLKRDNGKSRVWIFRTEAEHIPTPALLKCWCLQGLLNDS